MRLLLTPPKFKRALDKIKAVSRAKVMATAQGLVHIYMTAGLALDFLCVCTYDEIYCLDSASLLFRHNTMTTAMLTNYFCVLGEDWRTRTLAPIFSLIHANTKPIEIERMKLQESHASSTGKLVSASAADATKGVDADISRVMERNRANLFDMGQVVVDAICASLVLVPRKLRILANLLKTLLVERFGDEAGRSAVCSVVFLRFFCPGLSMLWQYPAVGEGEEKVVMRQCVLLTKFLQKVANNKYVACVMSFALLCIDAHAVQCGARGAGTRAVYAYVGHVCID